MSRGSRKIHRFVDVWAEVHGVDLASQSNSDRARYSERVRHAYSLFLIVSGHAGIRNPNRLNDDRYRELVFLAWRLKRALEPARLGHLVLKNGAFREDVLAKAAEFVANAECEPPGLDAACRRLSSSFAYGNKHFLNKFSMDKLRTFSPVEFEEGIVSEGRGAGTRKSTVTHFNDYYPFLFYLCTGHALRGSGREYAEAERKLRNQIIHILMVRTRKYGVDRSLFEDAYAKARLELIETALTPDCGYLYQSELYAYMLPVCLNILYRQMDGIVHGGPRSPEEKEGNPIENLPAPEIPCALEEQELIAVYSESFQLVLPTFQHSALVKAVWVGMILEKCGYGHFTDDMVVRYCHATYGLEPALDKLWQTRRRLRQRMGAVVRNRVHRALGEPAVCSFRRLMMAVHADVTMDPQAVSPFLQMAALERAAQNDTTLAWVTLALMLHKGTPVQDAEDRTWRTLRLSAALSAIGENEIEWSARIKDIVDRYRLDRATIRAKEQRLRSIDTGVTLFGRKVNLAFSVLPLWYLCSVCGMSRTRALDLLDIGEFYGGEDLLPGRAAHS